MNTVEIKQTLNKYWVATATLLAATPFMLIIIVGAQGAGGAIP